MKRDVCIIDDLLYLIASRLDIMQDVAIVGRFQEAPIKIHVLAAKIILRHLRATMDYGMWYPRGNDFSFTVYSNFDWEGDIDDRKSKSSGAFFLRESIVS